MKEGESGGEGFLKRKYDLHKAPETEEQAKRTERRTGEKVPQDPSSRISNYLDRFNEILERPSKDALGPEDDPRTPTKERGIEALKRILYRKNVIRPEDIPEAYFGHQRRIAREQGHGDIELTQEMRDQLTEVIIADQKSSLDTWVDYLSGPDAVYPDWLKYWATRSILQMGEYDKGKKKFTTRSKGTTKPFPNLNQEALANVFDAVGKKHEKQDIDLERLEEEGQEDFRKLLQGENFPKLYAWAIEKVTPESKETFLTTEGEWVKYDQDADHMPLVESLQGHGTGWCTAVEDSAEIQLKSGDFYVYYSKDMDGNNTIPRSAIRMEGERIAEVRGIAENQNLDPSIGEVVQKKMKEFPDGEAYGKKAGDMKRLTEIEHKTDKGEELTKEELRFFYEIDSKIKGFGYGRDPRIEEIRSKRDTREDASIVLDYAPDQIAWSQEDITPDTKAYIGPLFPGVFGNENLHIYASFPEGRRIERFIIKLGGKTPEEYETELKEERHHISDRAEDILRKMPVSKEKQVADFIRLTVADLGFTRPTWYDKIQRRAKELGLELAPAEVGPPHSDFL